MISVISFPERGPYGKSSYRGNCSGYVQKALFEQFKVREVTDPMAGSFTTRDVAEEMGITSHCYDLSTGHNWLLDEIQVPEEAMNSDFWFFHPPYSALINIPYAGHMWSDKEFEKRYGYDPKKYDLGAMDWPRFIAALNFCIEKFYMAMSSGARMAILCGDIKRQGICYSMIRDMAQPGQLENICVKMQHNCVSDTRSYSNSNFIPIVHEYIMILKKISPYIMDYWHTIKEDLDIRDSKMSTWEEVVRATLEKLGTASLEQIYNEIDGHKKCESNSFWKEKIRQTLQKSNLFHSTARGVWSISA